MDLSILDGHMWEPHIRGAAAFAISLEEQGVNPDFQADYPQVIKAANRIAQVDVRGLRTRPVSGRIDEHKLPRGGAPSLRLDADVQSPSIYRALRFFVVLDCLHNPRRLSALGGCDGAWENGQGRGHEKPDRQPR